MLHLELQPELEARLTADANHRGLSLDQLFEEITADYLAVREDLTAGMDDVAAGRTRPAREVFAELHEQRVIRD